MHSCPHSSVNGTGVDDTRAGLRVTATHGCPSGATPLGKPRGSQNPHVDQAVSMVSRPWRVAPSRRVFRAYPCACPGRECHERKGGMGIVRQAEWRSWHPEHPETGTRGEAAAGGSHCGGCQSADPLSGVARRRAPL